MVNLLRKSIANVCDMQKMIWICRCFPSSCNVWTMWQWCSLNLQSYKDSMALISQSTKAFRSSMVSDFFLAQSFIPSCAHPLSSPCTVHQTFFVEFLLNFLQSPWSPFLTFENKWGPLGHTRFHITSYYSSNSFAAEFSCLRIFVISETFRFLAVLLKQVNPRFVVVRFTA